VNFNSYVSLPEGISYNQPHTAPSKSCGVLALTGPESQISGAIRTMGEDGFISARSINGKSNGDDSLDYMGEYGI